MFYPIVNAMMKNIFTKNEFIELLKKKLRNLWLDYLGKKNAKKLADILFKEKFGYTINWEHPQDLNEKINWLAFNSDTSKWTELSDKYLVRDYVKSKDLEHILPKLYAVWHNPGQINFEVLPKKFVLKCNHDAGSVFVIEDKEKLNIGVIRSVVKKCLERPFGIRSAEPHYIGIKRLAFAEEFIENQCLSSDSLVDYKFWSFHGKTQYCLVCSDKTIFKQKKSIIYDVLHWQPVIGKVAVDDISKYKVIPRPQNLNEMIKIVYILSKDFPECRVDLYEDDKKVYFGELTFTSGCGRMGNYTKEFLLELGNCCDLSKVTLTS